MKKIIAVFVVVALLLTNSIFSFAQVEDGTSLKIQMYNENRTSAQQLNPQIKLFNTGTTSIKLEDVKLRYYFTVDGEKPMSFDCWTSVDKKNLTANFVKMTPTIEKADYYLEIGFTNGAGSLGAGKNVSIVSWFSKNDWSNFKQSNDYSFNSSSSNYIDWSNMTAYISGQLYWGNEPIAQEPMPTPEPTPTPEPELSCPTNIRWTAQTDSINLIWDNVNNATAYDIEVDGIILADLSTTTYTHANITADSTHTYKIRAKNMIMTSAWSQEVNAKTTKPINENSTLMVKLSTNNSATTQQPSPGIEIFNTGGTAVSLTDVKARYYFTIDGEKPLSIDFWTTANKNYVNATFEKMPIPSDTTDYYLEISFNEGAGDLAPDSKVGVYTWFNKEGWTSFNQANDYSFNNISVPTVSDKVIVYLNNSLNWGVEPILWDMLPCPSNILAVPSDNSIALSWDVVEGAVGYDIYTDGRVTENITETTYTHNWLNSGTLHTYKVRTRNTSEAGIWSAPLKIKTTGQQVLPIPTNVRGEAGENSIKITWNPLLEEISGYDVEVDGQIIDVATSNSYNHNELASGTQHTYRVRAKDGETVGNWTDIITISTIYVPVGTFNVNFEVDISAERAPISQYIYGTNSDLTGTENWGARRIGGNRLSTYNWENNASNAGIDWFNSSDAFVPWYYGEVTATQYDIPGIGVTAFHEKSLRTGTYTLITLQTAGYVAKDTNGSVSSGEKAPSDRWVKVKATKDAPFSLTPDLTDGFVYMDEFVSFLVNKFGDASTATGIKGYSLDNEPALWSDTHPLMHPNKTGAAEVLDKSVDLAKAIKNVDTNAEVFGPAMYGFSEFFSMQDASDWNALKANYDWYIDYYLDNMRIESLEEGKRLLDVLDVHWYPEVSAGGARITSSNTNDNIECNKARMQAPRTLWDPTYIENSWIGQWFGAYLPLIPRLQQSIDMYNPGTKLAVTEYNYGGEGHVSGGIATADALGIFGKYNVYLATYWKLVDSAANAPYTSAAFKMYNNYDGNNSKFGNVKVQANTTDIENSSIYASVFDESNNELHLIVMNKNYDYDMNGVFNLAGETQYTNARVYAFDSINSAITEREAVMNIQNNSFNYNIPKLTACHIVLSVDAQDTSDSSSVDTDSSQANMAWLLPCAFNEKMLNIAIN